MAKSTLREFLDAGSQEFLVANQDRIPKGWLNRQQIEEKTGMGKWLVNRRLKRLQTIGKVQVKEFRVKCGNNMRHVPYYYLPDYC